MSHPDFATLLSQWSFKADRDCPKFVQQPGYMSQQSAPLSEVDVAHGRCR